jgi:hypothetical protein
MAEGFIRRRNERTEGDRIVMDWHKLPPMEIEKQSFKTITRELRGRALAPELAPVIQRSFKQRPTSSMPTHSVFPTASSKRQKRL